MNLGLIDIILILSFLYLLFAILSNDTTSEAPTNIIFDDDIILINSNNNIDSSNTKNNKPQIDSKSNFENISKSQLDTNATIDNRNLMINTSNDNTIENISDLKSIDDLVLDGILSTSKNKQLLPLNLLSKDNISNRYNRKLNNIPDELDLVNIRNTNIINTENFNNYDDITSNTEDINNNNNQTIKNNNNIDSKIFNKSNKLQKLFKDSKTIAGRLTKNSIIEDYKNELDYYENLRTPWWVSDAKYD